MILFIFFPQIVNCRAVLLPLLLQDLIHLRFRLCPYLIQPLLRPGLQILVKLVSLCLNLLLDLILLGFRMFYDCFRRILDIRQFLNNRVHMPLHSCLFAYIYTYSIIILLFI